MKTVSDKTWSCHFCGYKMEAVTDLIGDATPSQGDVTTCLNCGGVYVLREKWDPISGLEYDGLPDAVKHELRVYEKFRREIITQDLSAGQD